MKQILLFLLYCAAALGQKAEIQDIHPGPYTQLVESFPKIIMEKSSVIAQKINDTLQSELFKAKPGTAEEHLLDEIRTDAMPMLRDVSYKIILNDDRILCLEFNMEGCGAYCESFTRYYTFDLNNGQKIMPNDLFTESGLKKLTAKINTDKVNKIKRQLLEINKSLNTNSKGPNGENRNTLNEMLVMYKNCLQYQAEDGELSDYKFAVNPGKLYFYTERCSAHVNRAIDELDEFVYELEIKYWTSYLTPYGKSIFAVK
ncbi:MAG: hypothetical protein CFE23_08025 [Flavobacterium sp. BFFFF1]|uniref:hypothetical protein n=1 Tax=Flavobacterium sp. BFFFF1 TaxID=2015557 RepID=UPI000BCFC077|nr:hypothetical protein [Flavobacterium sp. BFFFF1]OYU80662.1 MAG: hypothetical protein CFE23_08025 [Flavobacterium sp. BFFFF1]